MHGSHRVLRVRGRPDPWKESDISLTPAGLREWASVDLPAPTVGFDFVSSQTGPQIPNAGTSWPLDEREPLDEDGLSSGVGIGHHERGRSTRPLGGLGGDHVLHGAAAEQFLTDPG